MRAPSIRATRRFFAAAVAVAVGGGAALAPSATAADERALNQTGKPAAKQISGTVNAGGAALRNASVALY